MGTKKNKPLEFDQTKKQNKIKSLSLSSKQCPNNNKSEKQISYISHTHTHNTKRGNTKTILSPMMMMKKNKLSPHIIKMEPNNKNDSYLFRLQTHTHTIF